MLAHFLPAGFKRGTREPGPLQIPACRVRAVESLGTVANNASLYMVLFLPVSLREDDKLTPPFISGSLGLTCPANSPWLTTESGFWLMMVCVLEFWLQKKVVCWFLVYFVFSL